MIPPITPPTDNLYKFVSLFGLTILLFSIYSLGLNYDSSADNKVKIEQVKANLQIGIYENSKIIHQDLNTDGLRTFRPGRIKRMDNDLHKIEAYINSSNLDPAQKIQFLADITKLNVQLDTLLIKQWGYIAFIIIGIFLMTIGFLRWHSREQKLRDKMLEIEHALKLLEKVHYTDGRKRTAAEVRKVAETLFSTEELTEQIAN